MALRNQPRYIQQRFPTSANDPVWHWSKLFKGIIPDGSAIYDADGIVNHRGHTLIIEAKEVGARIPKRQIEHLTRLASNPAHSVLLVGLVMSADEQYKHAWRETCWVWIGNPKWRDRRSVQYGSIAEFKAMMVSWFQQIDALADNEERKRRLKLIKNPDQLTLPFPENRYAEST